MGGYLARTRGDPRVISLDKANVLATSRLWRSVVDEVFKNEFPDLKVEHQLIDSAAMIMVKNPTQLNGVMIAPNLAGECRTLLLFLFLLRKHSFKLTELSRRYHQ